MNHLDPELKKCEWSDDEEAILIGMHKHHGNKVSLLAELFFSFFASSVHLFFYGS